ncbi:FecR domain-containing protein [Alteromonas sp. 1_MG-2023]|uniref:FecR family protein n=1 Tax=Alteromonas sp. 1_MG-2023 TaxID=3062669 RepID=UPI0026E2AD46|nr:FecR domain-containing protein [Alteromonas sp. 1_MG-2023]MDO6475451.1 FecR domain-containing protein [Alteromonas sp. 1_MG-2023]
MANQQEQVYLEAGEWIDRLADGELDALNRHRFVRWLEKSELHRATLEKMIATWEDPTLQAAFVAAKKASQPSRKRILVTWGSAVAASLLAIAIIWPDYRGETIAPSPQLLTAAHEALSDGSEVQLQPSSELAVLFSDDTRYLNLKKGQGYFDVAKDRSRPFVVKVGLSSVTAVGTAFNIDRQEQRVDVVVHEGIVEVRDNADSAPLLLKAGEQLTIENGVAGPVEKVDLAQRVDWRTGWIEVEDESLNYLFERLNRYAKKPILPVDSAVGNRRVAGRFKLEETAQTLAMLGSLYNLDIADTRSGYEISRQAD